MQIQVLCHHLLYLQIFRLYHIFEIIPDDLIVDGDVGNRTIRALEAFIAIRGEDGEEVLYKMLNSLQGAFYITLSERRSKDEKFIFGWFKNRVA